MGAGKGSAPDTKKGRGQSRMTLLARLEGLERALEATNVELRITQEQ